MDPPVKPGDGGEWGVRLPFLLPPRGLTAGPRGNSDGLRDPLWTPRSSRGEAKSARGADMPHTSTPLSFCRVTRGLV